MDKKIIILGTIGLVAYVYFTKSKLSESVNSVIKTKETLPEGVPDSFKVSALGGAYTPPKIYEFKDGKFTKNEDIEIRCIAAPCPANIFKIEISKDDYVSAYKLMMEEKLKQNELTIKGVPLKQ